VAPTPRILIPGGSGVFGSLLARELLLHTAAEIVLAARDGARAAAVARELVAAGPGRVRAIALDLGDREAVAREARGAFAVACCAGPFQGLDRGLPAVVAREGARWLDLGDDPAWVLPLLEPGGAADAAAVSHDTTVVPGLSTVPALSGILARHVRARLPGARSARVALFIGNRNRKGPGAVASALAAGLSGTEPVPFPRVGTRTGSRLPSPDGVLLERELGLEAEFRVAFELAGAGALLGLVGPLVARLPVRSRGWLARVLAVCAAPASRLGSDVGCIRVELRDGAGSSAAATLVGHGQRLAILPCALALEAMLAGEIAPRGAVSPATLLPVGTWLERLAGRGLELVAA